MSEKYEDGIPSQERKISGVETEIDTHHKIITLRTTGEINLADIDKALNTEPAVFNEKNVDEMIEVWPNEINLHRYQEDPKKEDSPMITEVKIYFGSKGKKYTSYGYGAGGPNKDLMFFGGSCRQLPPHDRESRLRIANYEYAAWNKKTREYGHIAVSEDYSGNTWGDFKPEKEMEHPANYFGIRK